MRKNAPVDSIARETMRDKWEHNPGQRNWVSVGLGTTVAGR